MVSASGFGVGFGLILNGEIYRGSNMFAGETELFTLNIGRILKNYCDYCGDKFVVGGEAINFEKIQLHHLIDALKEKDKAAN